MYESQKLRYAGTYSHIKNLHARISQKGIMEQAAATHNAFRPKKVLSRNTIGEKRQDEVFYKRHIKKS